MKDFTKYDFTKFNPKIPHDLYVDADTIIYANAAACERDECVVTHIKSGRKKSFTNFAAFVDFLTNDERGKNFTIDDFDVPVIGFALSNIRKKFERLQALPWVRNTYVYVGGVGNYRKDMYPEYKANRPAKPLLFPYCYNYVIGKFAGKIKICDGMEAEDYCLADALANPNGVVGYVDKDLENQSTFFINYNNLEQGVFWITPEQAFYNLCIQLMIGDRSTDNIRGIDFVSPDLKARFKVSTKSIGAGTAAKLLEDVKEDIPAMKQRVAEVYKLSYLGEWKKFLDFTGKLIFITKERDVLFDADRFLEGVQTD